MIEFLKSDTFRRICAGLVGVALPFINAKLGISLPNEQVIAGMVLAAGYIAQSVANDMHARSTDAKLVMGAANAVRNVKDAAEVFNEVITK